MKHKTFRLRHYYKKWDLLDFSFSQLFSLLPQETCWDSWVGIMKVNQWSGAWAQNESTRWRLSGEHDTQNNPATTTTLMLTLIHSGSRQPSHNSRLWELESWFLFDWIKWGTEMAVYFVCFPRRPPICVCNVSSWSTSGDDNRVSRTLTRGHCYRFSLCTKPLNKYCYILYKIPEHTHSALTSYLSCV